MKVIDLLNKIANNEELPKEINFDTECYKLKNAHTYYRINNSGFTMKLTDDYNLIECLNDEVAIIEEDKKIEKLDLKQDNGNGNYYLLNEYGTKCGLTKHSKIIADKVNELVKAVNELRRGE